MPDFTKRHSRKILLLATFLSLLGVVGIIFFLPPTTSYDLGILSLSILLAFFPLFFIFTFGLITLIFRRPIFGILVGVLFTALMLLRLGGLTHPLFIVLVLGLFITSLLFFKSDNGVDHKR